MSINPTTPVRNLDYIRDKDERLYEALSDIITHYTTQGQQTNSNAVGQPAPPPAVSSVNVTGRGGYLHVAINDQGNIYRGIRYYVEHADNPHFTDAINVPMGDSRNVSIAVGNQTRYVRAYSAYISSGPSEAVYHGSQVQPTAVSGGGTSEGPLFLPSQSSGTAIPGQGISGPGPVPFRSETGIPPVR